VSEAAEAGGKFLVQEYIFPGFWMPVVKLTRFAAGVMEYWNSGVLEKEESITPFLHYSNTPRKFAMRYALCGMKS
jgi:hypothetical protein